MSGRTYDELLDPFFYVSNVSWVATDTSIGVAWDILTWLVFVVRLALYLHSLFQLIYKHTHDAGNNEIVREHRLWHICVWRAKICIGQHPSHISHAFNRHGPFTSIWWLLGVCWLDSCARFQSGNYEIIDFDLDTRPMQYRFPFLMLWLRTSDREDECIKTIKPKEKKNVSHEYDGNETTALRVRTLYRWTKCLRLLLMIELWLTCSVCVCVFYTFSFFHLYFLSGQSCMCHPNAVTEIIYDSSFRQPICRTMNCTSHPANCAAKSMSSVHCPLYHLREAINTVQPSKLIQIIIENPSAAGSENVSMAKCDRTVTACADPKNYERFGDYCIPQMLLKDYNNYRQFKMPTPTVIDIYADLDFLVFFCQTLRMPIYCEHIANLCVLTEYVRFSFPFFSNDMDAVFQLNFVSLSSIVTQWTSIHRAMYSFHRRRHSTPAMASMAHKRKWFHFCFIQRERIPSTIQTK